jgi:hypothetical protein
MKLVYGGEECGENDQVLIQQGRGSSRKDEGYSTTRVRFTLQEK